MVAVEARIEPATWLAVDVAVPTELGPTFEALAPAIGRLARARPLTRHLTNKSLLPAGDGPADLFVVSGAIEAVVRCAALDADPEAARLERARLERELETAEGRLIATRLRLADDAFVGKAPAKVVENARRQEADLTELVVLLRDRLRG